MLNSSLIHISGEVLTLPIIKLLPRTESEINITQCFCVFLSDLSECLEPVFFFFPNLSECLPSLSKDTQGHLCLEISLS